VEFAKSSLTSGHVPKVTAAAAATEEFRSIVRRVIRFMVTSFGAMLVLILRQECKTETQRAVVHRRGSRKRPPPDGRLGAVTV